MAQNLRNTQSGKKANKSINKQSYKDVEGIIITESEKQISKFIEHLKNQYCAFPSDSFVLDEEKECYSIHLKALEVLGISDCQAFNLIVSKHSIYGFLTSEQITEFKKLIEVNWPDGYTKKVCLEDLFPGLKDDRVELKIIEHDMEYIMKNGEVEVQLVYNADTGTFKMSLAKKATEEIGWFSPYSDIWEFYHKEPICTSFSEEKRLTIGNIIAEIDSPYIQTFFSAYQYMFKEGNKTIRTKLKWLSRQWKKKKLDLSYSWNRYATDQNPLIKIDKQKASSLPDYVISTLESSTDSGCYWFWDKDRFFSDDIAYGYRPPVRTYIVYKRIKTTPWGSYSMDCYGVTLYACDSKKAKYHFMVRENMLYEAIFFLWSYFSSNLNNKRESFRRIRVLEDKFGIFGFGKS